MVIIGSISLFLLVRARRGHSEEISLEKKQTRRRVLPGLSFLCVYPPGLLAVRVETFQVGNQVGAGGAVRDIERMRGGRTACAVEQRAEAAHGVIVQEDGLAVQIEQQWQSVARECLPSDWHRPRPSCRRRYPARFESGRAARFAAR